MMKFQQREIPGTKKLASARKVKLILCIAKSKYTGLENLSYQLPKNSLLQGKILLLYFETFICLSIFCIFGWKGVHGIMLEL
jgi:hypothetical protein